MYRQTWRREVGCAGKGQAEGGLTSFTDKAEGGKNAMPKLRLTVSMGLEQASAAKGEVVHELRTC
jgi:hypothetical protein